MYEEIDNENEYIVHYNRSSKQNGEMIYRCSSGAKLKHRIFDSKGKGVEVIQT